MDFKVAQERNHKIKPSARTFGTFVSLLSSRHMSAYNTHSKTIRASDSPNELARAIRATMKSKLVYVSNVRSILLKNSICAAALPNAGHDAIFRDGTPPSKSSI